MARDPSTRDLSDKHEAWLLAEFGGIQSPGSGNQFRNQLDIRQPAEDFWPLGIDGKSTQGKSISISLGTWSKLVAQAHDLVPVLAQRWYQPDNRLVPELDLVTLPARTFAEILSAARAHQDQQFDHEPEQE